MYIVIVCDHEITHTSYAVCRDKIYIKFMALSCGLGATASRLNRATMKRQFTFYQKLLVLIRSISERRKTGMTLKPYNGFELVYQPSYYQI